MVVVVAAAAATWAGAEGSLVAPPGTDAAVLTVAAADLRVAPSNQEVVSDPTPGPLDGPADGPPDGPEPPRRSNRARKLPHRLRD